LEGFRLSLASTSNSILQVSNGTEAIPAKTPGDTLANDSDPSTKASPSSDKKSSSPYRAGDLLVFPDRLLLRGLTLDHVTLPSVTSNTLIDFFKARGPPLPWSAKWPHFSIAPPPSSNPFMFSSPSSLSALHVHVLPSLLTHILVCCHGQRDARCGQYGPAMLAAIRKQIQQGLAESAKYSEDGQKQPQQASAAETAIQQSSSPPVSSPVHCSSIPAAHFTHPSAHRIWSSLAAWPVSHVGGHEFAGNAIFYPTGDWFGLLRNENEVQEVLNAYVRAVLVAMHPTPAQQSESKMVDETDAESAKPVEPAKPDSLSSNVLAHSSPVVGESSHPMSDATSSSTSEPPVIAVTSTPADIVEAPEPACTKNLADAANVAPIVVDAKVVAAAAAAASSVASPSPSSSSPPSALSPADSSSTTSPKSFADLWLEQLPKELRRHWRNRICDACQY
jgi:hypothetical protein